MGAKVSFEIVKFQSVLMEALAQKSDVKDIVFAEKSISIELSFLLRKFAWIRNLGLLKRKTEPQPTQQIWSQPSAAGKEAKAIRCVSGQTNLSESHVL